MEAAVYTRSEMQAKEAEIYRLSRRLEQCEAALTKTVSILTTYTNDGHNPPLEAARLVVEAACAAVEEKWAT